MINCIYLFVENVITDLKKNSYILIRNSAHLNVCKTLMAEQCILAKDRVRLFLSKDNVCTFLLYNVAL